MTYTALLNGQEEGEGDGGLVGSVTAKNDVRRHPCGVRDQSATRSRFHLPVGIDRRELPLKRFASGSEALVLYSRLALLTGN